MRCRQWSDRELGARGRALEPRFGRSSIKDSDPHWHKVKAPVPTPRAADNPSSPQFLLSPRADSRYLKPRATALARYSTTRKRTAHLLQLLSPSPAPASRLCPESYRP